MPLSTSRQQFLAYETNGDPEVIHYNRKGGVFITTCICISFIISAALIAVLVGVIVYYITYFKVSQTSDEFWDKADPFAQSAAPSPNLRLPTSIVPSFYRLKLKVELEKSYFSGEVYITIRAKQKVKEIILHSKNLNIKNNASLVEQIYETLHTKVKRDVNNATIIQENTNITSSTGAGDTIKKDTAVDNTTATENSEISTTEKAIDVTNKQLNTKLPEVNISAIGTEIINTIETQVTHSNLRNIKIVSIKEETGDRLLIELASELVPDTDYILQLSFDGNISNSLNGFYKSSYTENNEVRELGVTMFEPISARAAFPCFDEPAFKAKFEISIAHPQNISVLSNMKIAATESIENEANWQWTHFERSVEMSTYLVAYVLSNFQNVETSYLSKDNVTKTIRVWTRPSLISKAKYALTITPKLLSFYESVFGVPYALDKLDLIAIPDFASGAMENWGLITFRETTLLFDEKEGVPREKQNVAVDVAHELAHQWFGNLVTMTWWTDLWLNEGFATYIEYVGVDHIEPNWNMFESFVEDKMNLLRSDALKSTSPVSLQVIDAGEIAQKFNEISYSKGASLIRMLNHTISQELFRKGLLLYLNKWKYQNAEENDLWEAMSQATQSEPSLKDFSVVKFMNTWTRQAGYPVVNVKRNYDTGDVTFEQKLFSSTTDELKSRMDQVWWIPMSYSITASNMSLSTKPRIWLNDKSLTTKLNINASQALYVNVDSIGYYRVNYDQQNWELLDTAVKSGLLNSSITKAQLIDDAFNLAKSNLLNYSYALELSSCVIDGEDSKIVWEMLLNNFAFLEYNLKATSGYIYFQDYVKIILDKQLQRLNYGLKKPKDDNEAFLIENLVMWECLVESPRCLDWANAEFEKLKKQPDMNNNPIPSYLRALVYNMAIKHGGRREFDFFWNMFLNASDPSVANLIISNLPSTKEESLITLLLEKSLDEIPKQYAASVWGVESPLGTRLAQRFLRDNFLRVYDKFSAMDTFMMQAVLNGAFGIITNSDELDMFKEFALANKEKLMPYSQTIQKIIDTASLRIGWIKRYARGINNWFENYVHNHNAAITTVSPDLPQNITLIISSANTTNETTTSSP